MPSSSLQSRIKAFEAAGRPPSTHEVSRKPSPSLSNLLESRSPTSPSSSSLAAFTSLTPEHPQFPLWKEDADRLEPNTLIRSASSELNAFKAPNGIGVRQQPPLPTAIPVPQPKPAPTSPRIVPTMPTSYAPYKPKTGRTTPGSPTSLINLDSFPRIPTPNAPPLPPRKPGVVPDALQLRRVPSLALRSDGSASPAFPPSPSSIALSITSPTIPRTPSLKHSHSISTSSFQSVSLDDAQTPSASKESFDIISPTSPVSSSPLEDNHDDDKTPVVLQRSLGPISGPGSAPSASPAPSKLARKHVPSLSPSPPRTLAAPAPALPPRQPQLPSAILARPATTPPIAPVNRKPPIPPDAQARYSALFERNLTNSSPSSSSVALLKPIPPRSARTALGWRGLSVDGIPDGRVGSSSPSPALGEDRLPGHVVKAIWICSKLRREKLQDIWTLCDSDKKGSLTKEAFVRGCWRIDEELRKARESHARRGVLR